MTTNDFTTAAHAESERLVAASPTGRVLPTPHGVAMAEWARTYLAEHEPTDAGRAEAAMDALGCELRVVENGSTTCDLHGGYASDDDVCQTVDMALSAARAVGRDAR